MLNRQKIFSKFKLNRDKFFKNAKQYVYSANITKEGQNMPNYDVHAKQHFPMPHHFDKGQIFRIWH